MNYETPKYGRREFLSRLGLGVAAGAAVFLPLRHHQKSIIKKLSQKEVFSYISGVDFEAYDLTTRIVGKTKKIGDVEPQDVDETIENWESFFIREKGLYVFYSPHRAKGKRTLTSAEFPYSMDDWMRETHANTLSFSPYKGDFLVWRATHYIRLENEREKQEEKKATNYSGLETIARSASDKNQDKLRGKVLQIGYEDIQYFGMTIKKLNDERDIYKNNLVLRISSNPDDYQFVVEDSEDPVLDIAFMVGNHARNLGLKELMVELETSYRSGLEQHNRRLAVLREISERSPEYKYGVTVSLDPWLGFDIGTGMWDPELTRGYWEGADNVTLNDYLSSPENLAKSIEEFKKAIGNKKLFVRIFVGSKRADAEFKDPTLKGDYKDMGKMLTTAYNTGADGTFVSDTNGAWTFNGRANPLDNGEIIQWLRRIHQDVFGIPKPS